MNIRTHSEYNRAGTRVKRLEFGFSGLGGGHAVWAGTGRERRLQSGGRTPHAIYAWPSISVFGTPQSAIGAGRRQGPADGGGFRLWYSVNRLLSNLASGALPAAWASWIAFWVLLTAL